MEKTSTSESSATEQPQQQQRQHSLTNIPLLSRILPFACRSIKHTAMLTYTVNTAWTEAMLDFGVVAKVFEQLADATRCKSESRAKTEYCKFWQDTAYLLRSSPLLSAPLLSVFRAALRRAVDVENQRAVDLTATAAAFSPARRVQQIGALGVALRNSVQPIQLWPDDMRKEQPTPAGLAYLDMERVAVARDHVRLERRRVKEGAAATDEQQQNVSFVFTPQDWEMRRSGKWRILGELPSYRNVKHDDTSDFDDDERQDDEDYDGIDQASDPGEVSMIDRLFQTTFFADCDLLSRVHIVGACGDWKATGGFLKLDASALPRALVSVAIEASRAESDETVNGGVILPSELPPNLQIWEVYDGFGLCVALNAAALPRSLRKMCSSFQLMPATEENRGVVFRASDLPPKLRRLTVRAASKVPGGDSQPGAAPLRVVADLRGMPVTFRDVIKQYFIESLSKAGVTDIIQ